MSRSGTDALWHRFWAYTMVVAVIFPIVLGIFLVVFQEISLTHPVVIGLFVLDFIAIMVSWNYSLRYYGKRKR